VNGTGVITKTERDSWESGVIIDNLFVAALIGINPWAE
jgi:hypothetical protein